MTILIAFQRVKLSECPVRNVRKFLDLAVMIHDDGFNKSFDFMI